jgi:RNA polymerase sigma factor (sigma-70 family)
MSTLNDAPLLRDFARTGSERAFGELVLRHTNLVYSAALRQTSCPELAREITQDVFTDLARKAPALAEKMHDHASLGGWLYTSTRYLALNAIRDERRRVLREHKLMHEADSTPDADAWADVAPVLDEAMAELNDPEREAVVLRYFQNLDFQSVGRALGVSDDTAQKRVTRALDHLRELLAKRGVTVGGSGLAILISTNAVLVAPAGMSAAILSTALAGTAISAATLATAAKTLVMTTTQKVAVTLVVAAFLITSLYKVYHADQPQSAAVQTAAASSERGGPTGAPTNRETTRPFGNTRAPASTVTADASRLAEAHAIFRRGQTHERERRLEEALADYMQAIAMIEDGLPVQPWFYILYFSRASLVSAYEQESKRDHALAIEDYTKALKIKPDDYSARGNRALAYARLRQYEEAFADYSRIIENPDTDFSHYTGGRTNGMAWAYEYRARAHQDAKNHVQALSDFASALQWGREPSEEITIHWYMAHSHKALQQFDGVTKEAAWLAERAMRWVMSDDGKNDERDHAHTAARFASEILDHKAPYQLEVLAAVKAKFGHFSEAVNYQERALKALPPNAEAERPNMEARLELYRAGKPLNPP